MIQTKGDGVVGLDAPVEGAKVLGRVECFETLRKNKTGRQVLSIIDLTLLRNRIFAGYMARRELIRYYCSIVTG